MDVKCTLKSGRAAARWIQEAAADSSTRAGPPGRNAGACTFRFSPGTKNGGQDRPLNKRGRMSRRDAASEAAVGFLTVVSSEPHGLVGGYLVLNALGRPLEFHCTAPVKPNRAQEILYGATLQS